MNTLYIFGTGTEANADCTSDILGDSHANAETEDQECIREEHLAVHHGIWNGLIGLKICLEERLNRALSGRAA